MVVNDSQSMAKASILELVPGHGVTHTSRKQEGTHFGRFSPGGSLRRVGLIPGRGFAARFGRGGRTLPVPSAGSRLNPLGVLGEGPGEMKAVGEAALIGQGDDTMALQFHLLDESARTKAIARLKEAIRRAVGHAPIGFGRCQLPQVLSDVSGNALMQIIAISHSTIGLTVPLVNGSPTPGHR